MNLAQFLEHWSIVENPFRGEEARTDAIFARSDSPSMSGMTKNTSPSRSSTA